MLRYRLLRLKALILMKLCTTATGANESISFIRLRISRTVYLLSIYIKMNECLFVCLFFRYVFGQSSSRCSQTFQESSSHPEEGRELLFFSEIITPSFPQNPITFQAIEWQYSFFKKRTIHYRLSSMVSPNL